MEPWQRVRWSWPQRSCTLRVGVALSTVLALSCAACSTDPAAPAVMSAPAGGGAAGMTALLPGGSAAASASAAGAGSSALPASGSSAGMGGVAGTHPAPAAMNDAGPAGTVSATDAGSQPAGAGAVKDSASAPILPPTSGVEGDGPFMTTQDLSGGPHGQSGLFYPTELGRDGLAHPIFVWGCGGGSTPSSYAMHMNRIASHGFVVIAEVEAIGDNGTPMTEAIDWLTAENARSGSTFFGKLDPSRIAAGGHSIGSVNTFLIADDPRLTTTIHVAGGSLDDVNDPSAPTTGVGGKSLIHPVAYICAESDIFGNTEKTEKDYAATTVPAFFTIIAGADHVAAASAGLPAMIAWLRWQLGGEDDRRASFLDPTGAFSTGKYMSRSKNW